MSLWTAAVLSQLITLSGGDRTELRARFQAGRDAAYSLETRANVQIAGTDYRSGWMLRYAPSWTAIFLGTPQQSSILFHTGHAEFRYRWRLTTAQVSQDFTYGQQNYYTLIAVPTSAAPAASADPNLPTTPTSPVAAVVQQSSLQYTLVRIGSSTSILALQHTLSRRATLGASFMYLWSGGLDQASRVSVPRISGPTVGAEFAYRLTPVDALRSLASATSFDSSRQLRSRVFVGEERWEHRFSPILSGHVGGGVSVIEDQGARPVALMGLTASDSLEDGRIGLTTTVETRPVIDPRTARADSRLSGRVDGGWVRYPWTVSGSIGTMQSLDWSGVNSVATYGWTVGATYAFARDWATEAGLGSTKMFFAGTPQSMLWSTFVAIRYQPTFARF